MKKQHPRKRSLTSQAKIMNAYKLRFLPTPLRGNTSCSHNFIMTHTIFSAFLRVSAAGIMPESLSINFKRFPLPCILRKAWKCETSAAYRLKKLEWTQKKFKVGFILFEKNLMISKLIPWVAEAR